MTKKDIQDIIEYIIQRDWFSEYYSKTNNIEETKTKYSKLCSRKKLNKLLTNMKDFLSPLADELLEKKIMTKKKEFIKH
ncbi:MAG: hypothetical protein DF280_01730 ['Brassica napus' phytoplasma]|nr:MAG: hypothetical protein DF280_01730 ['Brassica napus' phytoplasma]